MLGLGDLKQTRFYQEAFADGQQVGEQIGQQIGQQRGEQRAEQIGEQKAKIAMAKRMAKKGVKKKKIAEFLDLPLKEVRKILKAVKPANGKKKS